MSWDRGIVTTSAQMNLDDPSDEPPARQEEGKRQGAGTDRKQESLGRQIFRKLRASAGINILGQLLLLVSGVVLARALGKHGYGEYSFIMSVIALVGLPTKAGLPVLTVREIAQYRMAEDWGSIRGLLQAAGAFVLSYSVVAAAIMAAVVWWADGPIKEYAWAALLLPIVAVAGVRSATLRGLKLVILGQIPEVIVRPTLIVIGALAWSWLGESLSLLSAIQVTNVAALASFVAGLIFLWYAMPVEVRSASAHFWWRDWSKSLLPLSVFSGLRIFDAQLSLIIVGLVGSKEEVGLYKVALSGAALVSFGLGIANGVLAPYYATLLKSGDTKRIERIARRTSDVLVAVSITPALMLWIVGGSILSVTFGEEYRGAWLPMGILVVGQLVNVAAGSVGLLLNMGKYEDDALRSVAIATLVKFVVMAGMVPWFGIVGAAVGETLSMITWNVLMAIYVRRRIGIQASGSIVKI